MVDTVYYGLVNLSSPHSSHPPRDPFLKFTTLFPSFNHTFNRSQVIERVPTMVYSHQAVIDLCHPLLPKLPVEVCTEE